jgi:transcriptional regulator with XRE-family HTH domain
MSEKETQTPHTSEAKVQALGNQLRAARELADLSLRAAAAQAEISSAYLSQLESGSVKSPSPHILYRLAEVYDVSYADLMVLAGYVLPGPRSTKEQQSPGLLEVALRSRSALTEEEREALAEYLAWYRSRRGRPPEDR